MYTIYVQLVNIPIMYTLALYSQYINSCTDRLIAITVIYLYSEELVILHQQ